MLSNRFVNLFVNFSAAFYVVRCKPAPEIIRLQIGIESFRELLIFS
jgi:hypothetical protein